MRQRAVAQLQPKSVADRRRSSAGGAPDADAAEEAAELLSELKDAQARNGTYCLHLLRIQGSKFANYPMLTIPPTAHARPPAASCRRCIPAAIVLHLQRYHPCTPASCHASPAPQVPSCMPRQDDWEEELLADVRDVCGERAAQVFVRQVKMCAPRASWQLCVSPLGAMKPKEFR